MQSGEIDIVRSVVGRALNTNTDTTGTTKDYAHFKKIMEKYQENPQLLDPLLQEIVLPVALKLRDVSIGDVGVAAKDDILYFLSRLLWVLSSVRGYKTIIKLFPHAASDLEPALRLLEDAMKQEEAWEMQCVLLLWLSQLATLPFDLRLLSAIDEDAAGTTGYTFVPIAERIVQICKHHLALPGSSRELAAKLVGRLLSRPDMGTPLKQFLDWCREALENKSSSATFLIPGVLQALCEIAGSSSHVVMLPVLSDLWAKIGQIQDTESVKASSKTRKLMVKLVQRTSLAMISAAQGIDGNSVPEELEEALDLLLQGLNDGDTVVRWSAAKGIGRIAAKLPEDFAFEVISQVLELLEASPSATAWHGACLTIAELSRRGELAQSQLQAAAPLIAKALQLDIRRGAHSVGAHVRDAAAYVVWAIAKAYTPEAARPTADALAPSLLIAACYDREVNCRRAASAAFQEVVGRQGSYPHGIEICAACDYFALSSRSNAYLVAAPCIARYKEYSAAMRQHLLEEKLRHWDPALRGLASMGLAKLVTCEPDQYSSTVLDFLIPLCCSQMLEVRHGALLGLGELLLALKQHGIAVSLERLQSATAIPGKLQQAKLMRGKGAEFTRTALCRLIACVAKAQLKLSDAQQMLYQEVLDDNLQQSSHDVQAQAVAAFKAFFHQYESQSTSYSSISQKYLVELHSSNRPIRRGSALALGALPFRLLQPFAKEVLLGLAAGTKVEKEREFRDAESRVAAVKAMAEVTVKLVSPRYREDQSGLCVARQTLSGNALPIERCEVSPGEEANAAEAEVTHPARDRELEEDNCDEIGSPKPDILSVIQTSVTNALVAAMQDYSIDNRGDVGSWVREASMQALATILPILMQVKEAVLGTALQRSIQCAICLMLQQSVERIARVRMVAMSQLQLLLALDLESHAIPNLDQLRKVNWSPAMSSISSYEGIEAVTVLLNVVEYRASILQGLIFSIGGIDATLADAAFRGLQKYCSSGTKLEELCLMFVDLWTQNRKSRRMVVPYIKTAQLILGIDLETQHPFNGELAGSLLDLLEGTSGMDVSGLNAMAAALCQLEPGDQHNRRRALQLLLQLLVSDRAAVRRSTAQLLYLRLLEEDSGELEQVTEVLLNTAWDDRLEEAQQAQNMISQNLIPDA